MVEDSKNWSEKDALPRQQADPADEVEHERQSEAALKDFGIGRQELDMKEPRRLFRRREGNTAQQVARVISLDERRRQA